VATRFVDRKSHIVKHEMCIAARKQWRRREAWNKRGDLQLEALDFLQLQLLLPSASSIFFLIQQKRGEREQITRNIPKEGNRCTGRGKGGGVDFFLLSKLPFGSAGGRETVGATKDSGAAALAAAGGQV
jgi:hypothetical protein